MEELIKKLEEEKIPFTKREHPIYLETKDLPESVFHLSKKLVEQWQVFVDDISIVKGEVAFGNYEAYGGNMEDPERFATADEVISWLKKTPKLTPEGNEI